MGLTPIWRRLCRYPHVMAEEGLQVVRQWLEASSQLEEGEKGSGEALGGAGKARC